MNKPKHIIRILSTLLVLIVMLALSCNTNKKEHVNANQLSKEGTPKIQFDTSYYDFGNLIQGEQAAFTFKFKNTGTADLIIRDAYSTCGCAVPSYSKEPIKPGDSGKIDVIFDSTGKRGLQYKTVVLKLNTKISEKSLSIKANVIEKK